MMTTTVTPVRPWGMSRTTPFEEPPENEVLCSMEVDPGSQITVYRDSAGEPIQAGPPKHGTSRATFTSNPTSGGDGQHKNSPDDTKVLTYVPD
jgi:putative ATP-grasp target RiPP